MILNFSYHFVCFWEKNDGENYFGDLVNFQIK